LDCNVRSRHRGGCAVARDPVAVPRRPGARDAAIMYARACRAWYGRRAPRIVRNKIAQLQRKGRDAA
jgi:hypothetical protein